MTETPDGGRPGGSEAQARHEGLERHRQMRGRNLAVAGVLIGLVVLFYLITIVRMGAH